MRRKRMVSMAVGSGEGGGMAVKVHLGLKVAQMGWG
jgi:hypothetical protein